jgi:WXXGXW repeat (2 copies)
MKKQILVAAAALAFSLGTALTADAQIVVRIGPPPPRPVEVVPAARPGYYWVPGYHRWDGHHYVWVGGAYRRPPHAGAVWEPGEWREERGGHVWHEGRWR